MFKDPQDAKFIRDVFGDEIYDGTDYWFGDAGIFADPDEDSYDSRNPIMSLLVEQLGTRYILEQLGYERRTYRARF